jgi:hypothetical protein
METNIEKANLDISIVFTFKIDMNTDIPSASFCGYECQ